jgi:serine/threonine protein kinase
MGEVEARRYRIMGVIGKGGFGKVYRASLEGPEGFYKDVAIKLLREEDMHLPESTLQRFRDEARILGLVRDRAIVTVDPPTRLGGKWAVVMEYVDGVSCAKLLRVAPVPPGVALEIIQECARALDKVYNQLGRDGAPLQLLHRDIKPGNIQITPSGEVKILDFGIARATFAEREAETTRHIGGTFGYIAPERLSGMEGPEGDIYSLGVVLHVLTTGDKPTRPGEFREHRHSVDRRNEELQQVLRLAKQMLSLEPEQRPSARQVEDLAAVLRRNISGASLRRWCEEMVPEAVTMSADDLVGSILTETLANVPRTNDLLARVRELDRLDEATADRVQQGKGGAPILAVIALLGLGLMGAAGILVVGKVVLDQQQQQMAAIEPEPEPAAPPPPAPEPQPEVEPEPTKNVEPESTRPEPAPPRPKPVHSAVVQPKEVPKPAPQVQPEDSLPKLSINFGSVPLGAHVFIDGVDIGTTPMSGLELTHGTHKVRMETGGGSIDRDITVGRRKPTGYVWRVGDNSWEPKL